MIPLLTDGVDLVTASPYHFQGSVPKRASVATFLSKSASALYRLPIRQKIGTYTSCFRVYRRKALLELDVLEPGFSRAWPRLSLNSTYGAEWSSNTRPRWKPGCSGDRR